MVGTNNSKLPRGATVAVIGSTEKPNAPDIKNTMQRTDSSCDCVATVAQAARAQYEPTAMPARYAPNIKANAGALFVPIKKARNQTISYDNATYPASVEIRTAKG